LPPKTLKLELTKLPRAAGTSALYSGQGNELNRTAELRVDLTKIEKAAAIELSFDAWWEIEGGWDFAYVETSMDEGRTWTRRLPRDRAHMPAKHGHDGKNTLPGFTGLSGDLDGDGKNESNPACDAKAELAHGEDQAGQEKSPCLIPTWVRPSFDLSDLGGSRARIRLRYYTDLAAVMRGMLIDNVTLTGTAVDGDFEDADMPGWHIDGFARSPGRHELLVPHYYLLEYRDPYAGPEDAHRYDSALAQPAYRFYYDAAKKTMNAVEVRTRPGLVAWYYNGEYAWSENDPAINGPGKGYLLALDANPNEIPLPGMERRKRRNRCFATPTTPPCASCATRLIYRPTCRARWPGRSAAASGPRRSAP
jgi:bacillopeptidase F (M6 metalloprotease family)